MSAHLLLTLLLLLAAVVDGTLAPASAVAQGPTIPNYGVQASLDYQHARLEVEQTVRFRNQTGQPLDRAVFQVVSTYHQAFALHAATAQAQPSAASLSGSVLEVPLPAPAGSGATIEIGLRFSLDVPNRPWRLNAGQHALALGSWLPLLAPHRGDWDRHQFTDVGDAFVSDVADFDVRLTTSRPLVAAATGRTVEDTGTAFRFEARGVRDFALSLSPSYVVAETRADGATVRAYTASAERSRLYAETAAKYLRWFGQRFGSYPYRVLAVAEIDLPASYGGLEYPGLIMLSSSLRTPSSFEGSATDTLIGHEVAHQWFYSLVGNDQIRDPWLDEAFATYLPAYYYREVNPALFERLVGSELYDGLDGNPRAAGRPPVDSTTDDFPSDSPYFTAVYRQGGRFLDELRRTMGATEFDAALADTVRTFGDKLATPRAVLDLFQRHTSANLNPLITRYFSYGAYSQPTPAVWRLEAPEGPLRGSVDLFVGAEFPIASVEVWLDSRRLYAGEQNALSLDLSDVEPGDYLLLVRVLDHQGAQLERARRVSVALP